MNNNYQKTNKKLFKCPECGLNYSEAKWAERCEKWCKKYHSCNLEIIEHSIKSDQKNNLK